METSPKTLTRMSQMERIPYRVCILEIFIGFIRLFVAFVFHLFENLIGIHTQLIDFRKGLICKLIVYVGFTLRVVTMRWCDAVPGL